MNKRIVFENNAGELGIVQVSPELENLSDAALIERFAVTRVYGPDGTLTETIHHPGYMVNVDDLPPREFRNAFSLVDGVVVVDERKLEKLRGLTK